MKRMMVLGISLLLLLSVCTLSVSVYGTDEPAEKALPQTAQARFENLLNHNYAVGDDFNTVDGLLDAALIALRDQAVDGAVSNRLLAEYLNDCYGLNAAGMYAEDGRPWLPLDGQTLLPAKGFSSYHHTVTGVTPHEDGTYTVWSKVTEADHDGAPLTKEAVSRFAKADNRFGYVLLSLELLDVEPAEQPFI